jgi:hypothetical protein
MKKRKRKTAAEAMAEFEKDPAFIERRRQREEERRRAEEADARAEAPVVEELRKAGVLVGSVWDLVNSPDTYAQSLPILLGHLQRPYPDAVREGIARAVAVPGARFAWPLLVKLYSQERGQRTKDALAVAVANVADDETLDELIALARDVRHGESRVLLLNALERSRLPQARKALMELGSDPELQKEVQRILRRVKRVKR